MSPLPKFMSADDPVNDPDNVYIIHTQQPRFIAKRVEDEDENTHIDIVEEIDDVEGFFKNDPEKKETLLEELEAWYYDYMDWLEDDEDA